MASSVGMAGATPPQVPRGSGRHSAVAGCYFRTNGRRRPPRVYPCFSSFLGCGSDAYVQRIPGPDASSFQEVREPALDLPAAPEGSRGGGGRPPPGKHRAPARRPPDPALLHRRGAGRQPRSLTSSGSRSCSRPSHSSSRPSTWSLHTPAAAWGGLRPTRFEATWPATA